MISGMAAHSLLQLPWLGRVLVQAWRRTPKTHGLSGVTQVTGNGEQLPDVCTVVEHASR